MAARFIGLVFTLSLVCSGVSHAFRQKSIESPADLFEQADTVAIIRLDKGEYIPKYEQYQLTGRVFRTLKGTVEKDDRLDYKHRLKYSSNCDRLILGRHYLLFLRNGHIVWDVSANSELEIIPLPSNDESKLELEAFARKKFSVDIYHGMTHSIHLRPCSQHMEHLKAQEAVLRYLHKGKFF